MLAMLLAVSLASDPNQPGHCCGGDEGHIDFKGRLNCGTCIGADRELDCAWRQLALDMAKGKLGVDVVPDVHDALQLSRLCDKVRPAQIERRTGLPSRDAKATSDIVSMANETTVFVDAVRGWNDGRADGSLAAPFATLVQARDHVRTLRAAMGIRGRVSVLLNGSFHLAMGLELGPRDSGASADQPVRWATQPGEAPAVVSGALPLRDVRWSTHAPGVFVAQLPPDTPSFRSIYVDGERFWPARYPNNPDARRNLYHFGYSFNATWGPPMTSADGLPFSGGSNTTLCAELDTIAGVACRRNNTAFPDSPWFKDGWACRYDPCVASADYGDHSQYIHGSIHSPAFDREWSVASVSSAAVHALHDGSWGNWGFNVESKNGSTLSFRNGGFQEQTGSGWDVSSGARLRTRAPQTSVGGGRVNGFFVEMVLERTLGSRLWGQNLWGHRISTPRKHRSHRTIQFNEVHTRAS